MSAAKVLHRKWKFGTKIKDDENMVKWWKWSVLKCIEVSSLLTDAYIFLLHAFCELIRIVLCAFGPGIWCWALDLPALKRPRFLSKSSGRVVSQSKSTSDYGFNAERCRTFENGQAASQSICTVCTCFNQVDKLGETWWKCSNDFELRPRVFHNAVLRSC